MRSKKAEYSRYVEVYTQEERQHSCLVALYKGIDPEEVRAALESVLFRTQTSDSRIVAFEDVENNLLVSLTLLCKQPEILSAARYKILLAYGSQEVNENGGLAANGEVHNYADQTRVLLKTVSDMFSMGLLTKLKVSVLSQLIQSNDTRTSAAFQVYLTENNKEELIDTLSRLSTLASEEMDELGEEPGELTNVELIDLVSRLENKGYLNEEECIVLGRLSEMEHQLVRAACEVYLQDGDESDLADTLKRVSKHLSITRLIKQMHDQQLLNDEHYSTLYNMFFTGEPRLLQVSV